MSLTTRPVTPSFFRTASRGAQVAPATFVSVCRRAREHTQGPCLFCDCTVLVCCGRCVQSAGLPRSGALVTDRAGFPARRVAARDEGAAAFCHVRRAAAEVPHHECQTGELCGMHAVRTSLYAMGVSVGELPNRSNFDRTAVALMAAEESFAPGCSEPHYSPSGSYSVLVRLARQRLYACSSALLKRTRGSLSPRGAEDPAIRP